MGTSAPKLPTAIHPQPFAGAPVKGKGILAFFRKCESYSSRPPIIRRGESQPYFLDSHYCRGPGTLSNPNLIYVVHKPGSVPAQVPLEKPGHIIIMAGREDAVADQFFTIGFFFSDGFTAVRTYDVILSLDQNRNQSKSEKPELSLILGFIWNRPALEPIQVPAAALNSLPIGRKIAPSRL